VNLLDNMILSEVTQTDNAYFEPNSTYTWTNDAFPDVVYTFTTTTNVEGTPPAAASSGSPGIASDTGPVVSSQDVVGSAVGPSAVPAFRGTLTGAVSATGKPTLVYKGKNVTSLAAGRYTLNVTEKSATNGFILGKVKHPALGVTGTSWVGRRSASVDLTAGEWFFATRPLAEKNYFLVVS
jgi:hypothetical protein